MMPVLEVKDLTAKFDGRNISRETGKGLTAVDHVSFRLFPGETLGIVGESGSGKSTIARLITRLTDASSGQIFLHGEDITRVKGRRQRMIYRKIQMIFQSPVSSFDPRRTLGELESARP